VLRRTTRVSKEPLATPILSMAYRNVPVPMDGKGSSATTIKTNATLARRTRVHTAARVSTHGAVTSASARKDSRGSCVR